MTNEQERDFEAGVKVRADATIQAAIDASESINPWTVAAAACEEWAGAGYDLTNRPRMLPEWAKWAQGRIDALSPAPAPETRGNLALFPTPARAPTPAPAPAPEVIQRSEFDVGAQFVVEHGENWKFRPGSGFLHWQNPGEWRSDRTKALIATLMEYGRSHYCRIGKDGPTPDPTTGGKAATARGASIVVTHETATDPASWDADLEVLGLPDGLLINLRDGEPRRRTRDDLITWSTSAAPGAPGVSTTWVRFLREAVPEDALDWLQTLMGYAVTGHTREHLLIFIYGPAATGKGTFLSAVADALGSYSRRIDPSDLMESRSMQHPAWLADLAGRRLVIGDEVARGSRWATGRTKALVSGEPIRARKMRQDFAGFKPQAQVILAANHAPSLGARDTGLSRRLRVIPFEYRPAVLDPMLGQRIDQREVMRWITDGAARYLADGLPDLPESIRRATLNYEEEADLLGEFVTELRGRRLAKTAIFQRYQAWAAVAGVKLPLTRRGLYRTLREDYGATSAKSAGVDQMVIPE